MNTLPENSEPCKKTELVFNASWNRPYAYFNHEKRVHDTVIQTVNALPFKRSERDLAAIVYATCFDHAFELVSIPRKATDTWGFHPRTRAAVLDKLIEHGKIERVRQAEHHTGQTELFRIIRASLETDYTSALFSYPNLERALTGSYQAQRKFTGIDGDLKEALRVTTFYYDGLFSLPYLDSRDASEQVKLWRQIRMIPTGKHLTCSWERSEVCGRLFTSNPNIQGLPRELRRPGIISPVSMNDLWSIDEIACHINMHLIYCNKRPDPDFWKAAASGTGLTKGVLKEIIYRQYNDYGSIKEKGQRYNRANGLNKEDRTFQAVWAWFRKHYNLPEKIPFNGNDLMQTESEILIPVIKELCRLGIHQFTPRHDGIDGIRGRKQAEKTAELFERFSQHKYNSNLPDNFTHALPVDFEHVKPVRI